MAASLQPFAVRDDRRVWYIGCRSPSASDGCADEAIAAIESFGSSDVLVRAASEAERQQPQYAGFVAFVISGDADDSMRVSPSVVKVDSSTGLRTLSVGTFSGGSDVEIVLLQSNSVRQLSVKGSGLLTIEDHVLATSGAVSIATSGSGDLFADCSDAMDLAKLDIHTGGSADVQISLGDVRASQITLTSQTGDIALFTSSVDVSNSAEVTASGSGDLCWSAETMNVAELQVAGVSSADISIAPMGAASMICGKLDLQSVGSGTVDVGGVRCNTARVDSFGSSDVIVQASESISGEAVGSGSIQYVGASPKSVSWSYSTMVAQPVKPSYRAPTCKRRQGHQYPGDNNVLLSGQAPAGAAAVHGGGTVVQPSSAPVSATEPPPRSSPSGSSGSEAQHLHSILPLGVIALVAGFALLWFNRRKNGAREPHWDHFEAGRGFGRDASTRGEKQPLVTDHRSAYS